MAIPTATDKVILIDLTLPETNVFVLTEYDTNQQFSTLDVGSAFIGFKAPTETGLDGMTAKISLVNLDDDSFVNHTETIATATNHVALDNVYYYQVRRAELERQGKWIGRVSFVDNNGKTWGARKFTFLIDGDILDVKRTKLHAIDSVEDFMEDMSALMLDFNGFIAQMETNETTRGTTFTTNMTDFTDLFNQTQQLRVDAFNQAQAGRTGDFNASELSRTQTFDASEASRTSTFNASEASRGNTFTQNENARQAEFDLGESTRNDGFDADHLRAGNDHTQAIADHESYAGLLEDGVLTTQITAKLTELESTYKPDLFSVKQQLVDTLNKSAITLMHMFADATARDAYFVSNPTELIDLQFIKVGTTYQQYIEGSWTDSVPIVSEQLSATDQPIIDTGNYFTTDNTNEALQELGAHKVSTDNPHAVTKAQVGLGNVDNTSDANKPVSTAMQTALYLKANKTQEAWITPTLINGAIQDPTHPVQYYKDQFGRVYFRGKASNILNDKVLFTMPTGYRAPVNESYTSMIVPRSAMGTNVARIIIDGGWGRGVVYAITPATDIVHFDGFSYWVGEV